MDLKQLIGKYFEENELDVRLARAGIYICLADGISLYGTNLENCDQIGALVAGVWQAAQTMYQRFGVVEGNESDFRLGFDTSDCGIAIYPMKIEKHWLYFSVLFDDETNPARLKSLARNCANSLTDYLGKTYNNKQQEIVLSSVFSGLTDREIDEAFAFVGTK